MRQRRLVFVAPLAASLLSGAAAVATSMAGMGPVAPTGPIDSAPR